MVFCLVKSESQIVGCESQNLHNRNRRITKSGKKSSNEQTDINQWTDKIWLAQFVKKSLQSKSKGSVTELEYLFIQIRDLEPDLWILEESDNFLLCAHFFVLLFKKVYCLFH